MSDASEESHWGEFFATLKERLLKPFKHPTFVMYFVGIIVVVGGFGLFDSIYRWRITGQLSQEEFCHALERAAYTYFVAIAATAAVDLILVDRQRKSLLMFFLLCFVMVIMCALLAASSVSAVPSIVGYLLALFLWWVANADNSALLDTPTKPDEAAGGDVQAEPSGNMSGYKA